MTPSLNKNSPPQVMSKLNEKCVLPSVQNTNTINKSEIDDKSTDRSMYNAESKNFSALTIGVQSSQPTIQLHSHVRSMADLAVAP